MRDVAEDGANEVSIEGCTMDAKPIHIIMSQIMTNGFMTCFNIMTSSRTASYNQKKLAFIIFRQFFTNKVIELLKKLSSNSSIGDNKGSPNGNNNALSALTVSHNSYV